MPDAIRDHFGDALEYVVEDQPLGTGGAIAYAARGLGETFVVCNGDILTDLDLTALVAFHRSRRAQGHDRAAAASTTQPLRAGAHRARDGAVEAFIEKPTPGEVDVDTINAGTYVMEPDVLDLIAARTSPCRSSARCSRGWSATASTAGRSASPGSTSARRRATWRRTSTQMPAGRR